MRHDDEWKRRLAARLGDVGRNGAPIPSLVGDVLHVGQPVAFDQRLLAADLLELACLQQIVGARIPWPPVEDRHGVAVRRPAGDPHGVGVGNQAGELLDGRPLHLVEVLEVQLVLDVHDARHAARLRPGIGMFDDAEHVHVGTSIEQVHLGAARIVGPSVEVHCPQPRLVVAVVRHEIERGRVVGIEASHRQGRKVVFVMAQDVLPRLGARHSVVDHVLLAAHVVAEAKHRLAIGGEHVAAHAEFAAQQQPAGAFVQVELVVGARLVGASEPGVRSGSGRHRRHDDLVGRFRQQIVDGDVAVEFRGLALGHIEQHGLVFVDALIESLDLPAHPLPGAEQDLVVVHPIEADDLHGVGTDAERRLGQVRGVVDLDDRVPLARRDLHQREVRAIARHAHALDDGAQCPVLDRIRPRSFRASRVRARWFGTGLVLRTRRRHAEAEDGGDRPNQSLRHDEPPAVWIGQSLDRGGVTAPTCGCPR